MKDLRSRAAINGHPLHPMLVPLPITLFLAALATDIAFVVDGSELWAQASKWLLGAGIVGALLAALAGFTDFIGNSRVREFRDASLHMFANLAAVAIELINFLLRLGDERTAGLIALALSGVVALVLLFGGWMGGELVFRYGVGHIGADDRA